MLTNEQKLALVREKVFQLRPRLASFNYEWEEELVVENKYHRKSYWFIFLNRELKMRLEISVNFEGGILQPGVVSDDSISPWLHKPYGSDELSFEPAPQRRAKSFCIEKYEGVKLPIGKFCSNRDPVREYEPFLIDFFSEFERGLNTYLMEFLNGIKWESFDWTDY